MSVSHCDSDGDPLFDVPVADAVAFDEITVVAVVVSDAVAAVVVVVVSVAVVGVCV